VKAQVQEFIHLHAVRITGRLLRAVLFCPADDHLGRYDAEWFRDALEQKGIKPCIPGWKSRAMPVKYDNRRYKRRNRIEIMFGRLKDWRRVATRYDRCPTASFSALALAATVLFWL
jgi:transposase